MPAEAAHIPKGKIRMKTSKGFILAAAFSAALMAAPAGFAQDSTAKLDQQQGANRADQAEHRKQMHDKMVKELGLTADQQTKMKALRENTRGQLQALRNNDQLTQEQKHEQARQIKEQTRSQMQAILTPEQQKKFAEMKKQHQGKHGKHRGHQGQPGGDDAN
jgi:protein CpxP